MKVEPASFINTQLEQIILIIIILVYKMFNFILQFEMHF